MRACPDKGPEAAGPSGPRLRHPAVPALLQTFGSPAALAQAGTEELIEVMTNAAPWMRTPRELAGRIHAALAEQSVQVPGTDSAGEIISGLAESLAVLLNAQTGPVPGLVRLAEQPRIAGLLRQKVRRRPARHAQTPHPLSTQARTSSLTKPTDLDRTDRRTPRHARAHDKGRRPLLRRAACAHARSRGRGRPYRQTMSPPSARPPVRRRAALPPSRGAALVPGP